eukprot:2957831-Pleurochrysis_carterae.AAC.1
MFNALTALHECIVHASHAQTSRAFLLRMLLLIFSIVTGPIDRPLLARNGIALFTARWKSGIASPLVESGDPSDTHFRARVATPL